MTDLTIKDREDALDIVVDSLPQDNDVPFMAAIWTIEEGKIVLKKRVTWRYPTGDFMKSLRILKEELFSSLSPEEAPPLPNAELPPDLKEFVLRQLSPREQLEEELIVHGDPTTEEPQGTIRVYEEDNPEADRPMGGTI